ncbi:S66 peptidase family protein [Nubsella zeaxanthinifaciens]|jgi:muramoyltetrapeptide carboxypeptidase|uniref:S66 peptidase family protein n=1 Tax=Nubsella zeaxanthinifaciens TaxID=392412 RepID=UPI000DE37A9E|nr:LD-carboxypeptidase [Nubsella zeaxanthinifaciens]
MNRKLFLASLSALVPTSSFLYAFNGATKPNASSNQGLKHKRPPYLKQGDIIGITCPAGYITKEEIAPAVQQMESWGFKVVLGQTVGARDFTFGGTDQERLQDLQQMLNDPSIKAIMCARGGYGAVRIVDQLDFSTFKISPKWIIGFSDITILHCHLNTNFKFASIHSKMCNSFPSDWATAEPIQIDTIKSIEKALKGEELMTYDVPFQINNRLGVAEGELIGGNLRCIENLSGSKSAIETDGKILFVEDVGEYLYSIDRMFFNLKRSGKLNKLKGLIVGGFRVKKDEDNSEGFGQTLEQIVLDKVKEFDYPVCFDFPVGHQRANFALKCGVKHQLSVASTGTQLKELA